MPSPAPRDGSRRRPAPVPIRVVTWNLEWAPRSRRERIARRLEELDPGILAATEADREILPAGGHAADTAPDTGYGVRGGRRKGILWSRWPLEEIDRTGDPGLPPGRFVAATCRTPLGPVRLLCACVPWSHAHVSGGRRDRTAWEEHETYLVHLRRIVADRDPGLPTLLLGDLNQRIPRARTPRRMAERLAEALGDLELATGGAVPGIDRQVIDHIACSPGVVVADVLGTDRHDGDGRRLSDHDAVALTIRALPGS
jgi:endonuclease/exonuclease/phosphatase family metal-dependent hydrolase